jgi:hypothetical protein
VCCWRGWRSKSEKEDSAERSVAGSDEVRELKEGSWMLEKEREDDERELSSLDGRKISRPPHPSPPMTTQILEAQHAIAMYGSDLRMRIGVFGRSSGESGGSEGDDGDSFLLSFLPLPV